MEAELSFLTGGVLLSVEVDKAGGGRALRREAAGVSSGKASPGAANQAPDHEGSNP